MSSYEAIMMKKKRDERREKGLCTRCGGEREDKEYILCQDCREYIAEWKQDKDYSKPEEEKVVIRTPRKWNIENEKLYKALIEKRMPISELANRVGVTTRTAERWVFQKGEPKDKNKNKINKVLGKEIYEI